MPSTELTGQDILPPLADRLNRQCRWSDFALSPELVKVTAFLIFLTYQYLKKAALPEPSYGHKYQILLLLAESL